MVKKTQTAEKAKAQTKGPQLSREEMLNILRQPVITEKATRGSEFNQVSFYVPQSANKPEIRAAVEAVFKVKVTGVNTVTLKGKKKFFRGRLGERSDRKKAIVTLAEGQSIDITSGI